MYINYNGNNNNKESHPRSPLQCYQVRHPLPYSLFQWQRRCQQEQQKRNRLRLAKQKLCRHNMLFYTFLCRLCMTMMWKYLISHYFCGECKHTTMTFFSFPVLQYSLLDFNSRKNTILWWIEWDKCDKVWRRRIDFLSHIFVAIAVVIA